jgi:hypothetical protein
MKNFFLLFLFMPSITKFSKDKSLLNLEKILKGDYFFESPENKNKMISYKDYSEKDPESLDNKKIIIYNPYSPWSLISTFFIENILEIILFGTMEFFLTEKIKFVSLRDHYLYNKFYNRSFIKLKKHSHEWLPRKTEIDFEKNVLVKILIKIILSLIINFIHFKWKIIEKELQYNNPLLYFYYYYHVDLIFNLILLISLIFCIYKASLKNDEIKEDNNNENEHKIISPFKIIVFFSNIYLKISPLICIFSIFYYWSVPFRGENEFIINKNILKNLNPYQKTLLKKKNSISINIFKKLRNNLKKKGVKIQLKIPKYQLIVKNKDEELII